MKKADKTKGNGTNKMGEVAQRVSLCLCLPTPTSDIHLSALSGFLSLASRLPLFSHLPEVYPQTIYARLSAG